MESKSRESELAHSPSASPLPIPSPNNINNNNNKPVASFRDFCKDHDLPIENDWQEYFVDLDTNADILIDETLLNWCGYTGNFRHKNHRFKCLIYDTYRQTDQEIIIPHDTKRVKVDSHYAILVVLKLHSLLESLLRMNSSQAKDMRSFLCKLAFLRIAYRDHLDAHTQRNILQGHRILKAEIDAVDEKLGKVLEWMQRLASLEANQKSMLDTWQTLYDPLLTDFKMAREETTKAFERQMKERDMENACNLVSPVKWADRRSKFCIIDYGNGMGYALRRQAKSFPIEKAKIFKRVPTARVVLEVPYSPNSINLFNNIKIYAKERLRNKVWILGNEIAFPSRNYDMKAFIRDIVHNVPDLKRIKSTLVIHTRDDSLDRKTSMSNDESEDEEMMEEEEKEGGESRGVREGEEEESREEKEYSGDIKDSSEIKIELEESKEMEYEQQQQQQPYDNPREREKMNKIREMEMKRKSEKFQTYEFTKTQIRAERGEYEENEKPNEYAARMKNENAMEI